MSYWVVVVDDDVINLKVAKSILNKHDIKATVLKSGRELLRFMQNNTPDVVLLDIMMIEMDGFETYEKLRQFENEQNRLNVPVIFLTAEKSSVIEKRGLELGAADFIRKPFNADVLIQRIENTVFNSEKIKELTEEAAIDRQTGFLNKASVNNKLEVVCRNCAGVLVIVDIDSFKLVNDMYGHDAGDKVLSIFSDILRSNTDQDDVIGRIGGDEFIMFCMNVSDESIIKMQIERMNVQLVVETRKLVGDDFKIPIGVSAGVVFVPEQGNDYGELFRMADKALYYVKKNGKHGFSIYDDREDQNTFSYDNCGEDMEQLSKIMEEREEPNCALWIGQNAFINIYRFLLRYIHSYNGAAYKAIFTILPGNGESDEENFAGVAEEFGNMLKNTLRRSDIMMQSKTNQFFLLLPELVEKYADNVVNRIMENWNKMEESKTVKVVYDMELIENRNEEEAERRGTDQIQN